MSLKQLIRISVGEVGVLPGTVKMVDTGSYATVTAAGYLNGINSGNVVSGVQLAPSDIIECLYSFNEVTGAGTYVRFSVSISSGVITLVDNIDPSDVLLPVVSGNFAVFNNTLGQIKDLGYLPSDDTKTRVVMANGAVAINRLAKFTDIVGTVDDATSAATNMGDLYAGASGTAGAFRSYPSAATTGYLGLTGVANAGDFAVQVANASHGQASIHSLPDPANAAARILVGATATPFVSGNFPVASGTGGLMVNSGLAASNLQNKTNIVSATTANIGGAGAGPISVAVTGATAASVVVASVESSSNAVSVVACTATATGFDIKFSADPGAACLVNYVLFIAAQ